MKVETSYEAFSSLKDVKDCTKNPTHKGFIAFTEFRLEHLPEVVRTDAILKFINEQGIRVVRISVTKSDGQLLYGSGLVCKVKGSYIISTNNHVISNDADVKNCTVDLFYHNLDFTGTERCYGESLFGSSVVQDKTYFTFSPIPRRLDELNILDQSPLVANVAVTYEDDARVHCLGYAHMKESGTCNMTLAANSVRNRKIKNCDITFTNPKTCQLEQANFLGTSIVEEHSLKIKVDGLPAFVMEMLKRSWEAPWSTGCDQFIPAVISHPHGGPKMISLGKSISVETEKDGFLKKLYHTAPTCPGSSGSLVLTLGGDATAYAGYPINRCIHIMGERCDSFHGIPTETGNINVSNFND